MDLEQATQLVRKLVGEGKTGLEVAQALYDAHVHYQDAVWALRAADFVASVELLGGGVNAVHVSNSPQKLEFNEPLSAVALFVHLDEPRALPLVVWHSNPAYPEATKWRGPSARRSE